MSSCHLFSGNPLSALNGYLHFCCSQPVGEVMSRVRLCQWIGMSLLTDTGR